MPAAVIETENVSKWFGSVIALCRFTLTIQPGISALLGPNGAGKSTFFNLVTGQTPPSTGAVRVFGVDPRKEPGVFRRIGLCADADSFYESMSGLEFVVLMARLSGLAFRDALERARSVVDSVGMTAACHKKIRTYSKGMRQRIKLAQAVVHDPDLVLLDEPMTGLDPLARHEVSEAILKLGAEGRTIVVSSHILHEVESLTQNLVVMARGRLLATGDVHEIRESLERHPYKIVVKCQRPRDLALDLMSCPAVEAVEIHEGLVGQVTVATKQAHGVFGEIQRIIVDRGLVVDEISCPDDNIESVFEYLVRES